MTKASKTARFVSYMRVSTKRQGASGLGLEAQREAVQRHVAGVGGKLVGEYRETESGGKNDDERPQLAAALARCRATGSVLLIAKLDRLSRRVSFLSALMDTDVPFVCCDNPSANRLTLHILASVAEAERAAISERTRVALAAAKRRGVVLGGFRERAPNIARYQKRGSRANVAAADARLSDVAGDLRALAEQKLSLREIASELNGRHIKAPRGGEWSAVQVSRALARLEAA